MGLFSSSKSNSNVFNTDKRLVTGEGSVGVSADSSTVTMNVTDAGIVSRALDSIDMAGATNADGFARLLKTAAPMFDSMFDRGQALIGQTQSAVADAYGQARNNQAGTIDQRTMIALAVLAAIAVYATKKKKGG